MLSRYGSLAHACVASLIFFRDFLYFGDVCHAKIDINTFGYYNLTIFACPFILY